VYLPQPIKWGLEKPEQPMSELSLVGNWQREKKIKDQIRKEIKSVHIGYSK